MRTAVFTAALAVAIQLILPAEALGQFSEYTQPGSTAAGGETVERESLETAIEEARWHLGPIRVEPWVGLRDLTWNENPGGTVDGPAGDEGDLTASGGAGFRSYLPVGPDVVVSAHALPEYSWWADQEDLRRLNGRYGVGIFAFFNRLTLQATARRSEQLAILSYEFPEQGNTRRDQLALATEVELGFSTSVFTEVGRTGIRYLLEEEERTDGGAPLQLLDRDEDRVRVGVRYRPRERWTFGVGVALTESDSVSGARDLSNEGEAPLVEVRYQGARFGVAANAERRTLEPLGEGSEFRPVETTTAGLQVEARGNRVTPAVYLRRQLGLAVNPDYTSFVHDVVGVSTRFTLGRRTDLRLFAETGSNEFERTSEAVPVRTDDVTSYGGELGFRIGRSLRFTVGGYQSDFDSSLPGLDRTVRRIGTGVTLGLGGSGEGAGWP